MVRVGPAPRWLGDPASDDALGSASDRSDTRPGTEREVGRSVLGSGCGGGLTLSEAGDGGVGA